MSGAYNLQGHSAFSTHPLTEFHFIFWLLSSPHKLLLSCSLALGQAENPLELLSFSLALRSGSPSTPHLEKLLGMSWQSCLRVGVCFSGATHCGRPYGLLHNPQFPMPLTSFVKEAKKVKFSISQLSHLTKKENMPFWTNSKASLGESHLPLFFPIIPAWNVDVKVRCAAAILQMWGCKPEGKGLHGRQKGTKLDSILVPDGILEPSSQLWIVSSRLTYVMNYTHTYDF